MRKKLYFGHPKGTYDTELERAILKRIAGHPALCYFRLINPGLPIYDLLAAGFRETHPSGSSMPLFLAIARSCDAGVFLVFPDGKWTWGVFDEAAELYNKGAPVWAITFEGSVSLINRMNPVWRLNKEDTSKRNHEWKSKLKP